MTAILVPPEYQGFYCDNPYTGTTFRQGRPRPHVNIPGEKRIPGRIVLPVVCGKPTVCKDHGTSDGKCY